MDILRDHFSTSSALMYVPVVGVGSSGSFSIYCFHGKYYIGKEFLRRGFCKSNHIGMKLTHTIILLDYFC